MLSPQVARQLGQLVAMYQKSGFAGREFSHLLAGLLRQADATDMLDALPEEAVPRLKEAMIIAAQKALDADCLQPEKSPFDELSASDAYYSAVARLLVDKLSTRPQPTATVVCLPSFEVEWAIRIRGALKRGYSAILTEAEESIYLHGSPCTVGVRVRERSFDAVLGEALFAIWRKMLLRTRHPRQPTLGIDGVTYHFACWGSGMGNMAGRTWSPDVTTLPGKLVALSHALRAYIEAGEGAAEQARSDLDACVAELSGLAELE